jgi:hypothetical protein
MRERLAAPWWRCFGKALGFDDWYRAGGADEAGIRRIKRATDRDMKRMSHALADGTLAHSISNWLWCAWGFK